MPMKCYEQGTLEVSSQVLASHLIILERFAGGYQIMNRRFDVED
jgi:hypothetical protein